MNPLALLLPFAALPLLMRGKVAPRDQSGEWEQLKQRLLASTDAVTGMALGSGPVQNADRSWTLHPGWYFAWVSKGAFQRLHNFLVANDANCKLRVSFGDDDWGHAFVFEVPGPSLLRWWVRVPAYSAPNERSTTIEEVSHSVGLDTEAKANGFWTYYSWASHRQPMIIDAPIDGEPGLPADEKRGGEHYGGEYPIDQQYRIRCGVCWREGWSFVRHAETPDIDPRGGHSVEWFRTEPGWTMLLPVSSGSDEGYRCPDHPFPKPSKKLGPPPPPHLVVKPGWYWFWVRPGAPEAAWRAMRVRYGAPLYVLHSRKTWWDVLAGSIELFEVIGGDIVWSMPGAGRGVSMPRPAPKGSETTLLDIVAEAI